MLPDLARALLAALAAAVLPGYFWAGFLRPTSGLAERLAYSTAVSIATVPVVALAAAHIAGSGITLGIAIASVAAVFGSGLLATAARGNAGGPAGPVLPRPRAIRDTRTLVLVAAAFLCALASMTPVVPARRPLRIMVVLLIAAAVAARVFGRADAAPLQDQAVPYGAGPPYGAVPPYGAGPPGGEAPGTATGPDGPRFQAASPRYWPSGPSGAAGSQPRPAFGALQTSPLTKAREPAATASLPAPDAVAGPAAHGRKRPVLRAPAIAVVLALTALRAYAPVIRFDWPTVRGGDMFSHAVMTDQLLSHGSYGSYLIYPPGFPAISAVICRLAGLPPLVVFPVLAPALLVVTALGMYALATRLWGWEYGVAAAALSGLVLGGAYASFTDGRYPDLVSSHFLIVMTVAALLTLAESPTLRSCALVTITAAAIVFYHSVASLYLAGLLALVALAGIPYLLWRRRRREVKALLGALAGVGALSVCYAWSTYQLGSFLTGRSATSDAVSLAVGSQPVLPLGHLLQELTPVIVWFGLLGVAILAADIRMARKPSQVFAALTVLAWFALMLAGSRIAMDGFPQRFERDLGAVFSVTGALGFGVIVLSLRRLRPAKLTVAAVASVAAAAAVATVGIQVMNNERSEMRPAAVVTPGVAAAGSWLRRHNTGGTIIATGMNRGIGNRAVLAMGGYASLQFYGENRLRHPRSLPPAGRKPLLDSLEVLRHPASCRATSIIEHDDVRYIVLYWPGSPATFAAFQADRAGYRAVFGNSSVVIYEPAGAACASG